jgi:hypothetical protein
MKLSEARFFNKPTFLKVHTLISGIKQHMQQLQQVGTLHYFFLLHAFDPIEKCGKNGLLSKGV